MGVAGFSVGSIIYSCLQFAEYFDLSGDCQLAIVAVKPALRIVFMVVQTVFIFSYTDVSYMNVLYILCYSHIITLPFISGHINVRKVLVISHKI